MKPVYSDGAVRAILRGRIGVGVTQGDEAGHFVMGRSAAALAMADLGSVAAEILKGSDRAPIWPLGLVGSIAHTRDLAIAVVGWAEEFLSLGVDVESERRRIDPRTARRVCTPEELLRFSVPNALLALFCAKEATYKALAPLGATRLGFKDVAYSPVGPGLLEGRIVSEEVDVGIPKTFTARHATTDGFVVAVVQIDRSQM
ncbi:MAG: 4'-phosphopantetheinyl transferase superfamily protein [Actinomycetota bacterium]